MLHYGNAEFVPDLKSLSIEAPPQDDITAGQVILSGPLSYLAVGNGKNGMLALNLDSGKLDSPGALHQVGSTMKPLVLVRSWSIFLDGAESKNPELLASHPS